jgi:hypothetical protein
MAGYRIVPKGIWILTIALKQVGTRGMEKVNKLLWDLQ